VNSHTPGRWEYVADMGEVIARHDERDDFRVAIVEDKDADGHLIAMAPEMLAFLDKLLETATERMPAKLVSEARNIRDRAKQEGRWAPSF
jgi:hypothetical protein